jgi:hypothetical protein
MGLTTWLREWIEDRRQGAGREALAKSRHQQLMQVAAGVGNLTLVCHMDTWDWLAFLLSGFTSWKPLPADRIMDQPDHMVELSLSGPRVVSILNATNYARLGAYADRAQGARIYEAFAAILDTIDSGKTGAAIPLVRLDDRPGDSTLDRSV